MADYGTQSKKVGDSTSPPEEHPNTAADPEATPSQKEIGGRNGPDPTRFGDWEKDGRCIDF